MSVTEVDGEGRLGGLTRDAVVWTVLTILFALLWFYEPGPSSRLGLCPFRLLTGWPCPGCGMGHALAAAAKGRIADSWGRHPFGPPVLVLGLLAWARAGGRLVRGRPEWLDLPRRWSRLLAWVGLAILAGLWAARLVMIAGVVRSG